MRQKYIEEKRRNKRWVNYLAALILTLFVYLLMKPSYTLFQPLESISMIAGYTAYLFIALTLLVGPATRWLPGRITFFLLHARRDLGIWAGILVLLHVFTVLHIYNTGVSFMFIFDQRAFQADGWLGLFFSKDINTGRLYFQWSIKVLANLLGLIAFGLLLSMWLTSSDRAQNLLGSAWKRIHSANWFVLILATFHGLIYLNGIKGTPYSFAQYIVWIMFFVLGVRLITFIRSVLQKKV